jgi:lipoyl(octanoyl) transferase
MGSVWAGPRPHWPLGGLCVYKAAMAHLFDRLSLWTDPTPRDGPAQMACDEALLAQACSPVLRVFCWTEPWVSIGYFVPWGAAEATRPGWPVCRRWTGGGVVVHDGDFTFSLVAPRSEPWSVLRPGESYRLLHLALESALQAAGCEAVLFEGPAQGAAACFAGPVRYDLVDGTRKVAGGAQRRTKRGLLHQGSVRQPGLEAGFGQLLAATLAAETEPWTPPEGFEAETKNLQTCKYGRDEFLRKERP